MADEDSVDAIVKDVRGGIRHGQVRLKGLREAPVPSGASVDHDGTRLIDGDHVVIGSIYTTSVICRIRNDVATGSPDTGLKSVGDDLACNLRNNSIIGEHLQVVSGPHCVETGLVDNVVGSVQVPKDRSVSSEHSPPVAVGKDLGRSNIDRLSYHFSEAAISVDLRDDRNGRGSVRLILQREVNDLITGCSVGVSEDIVPVENNAVCLC